MRNADELSTTVAPARTAMGAKRFEVLPPAENSARSTPLKLCSFNSRTVSCRPRNVSVLPAERAEANSRSSDNGKPRSSRQRINSTPTAPVAPTIATTAPRGPRPSDITASSPVHKRQRPRRVGGGACIGSTLPERHQAANRLITGPITGSEVKCTIFGSLASINRLTANSRLRFHRRGCGGGPSRGSRGGLALEVVGGFALVLGLGLRIVLDQHTDQLQRHHHHQQQQHDHPSHDEPHPGLHVISFAAWHVPISIPGGHAVRSRCVEQFQRAVSGSSCLDYAPQPCPPQSVIYPTADVGVIPRMGYIAVFHQVTNGGPYRDRKS